MDAFRDVLKFLHIMSFVFMSIPLFNLIVVNERASIGTTFNYPADRYMENIIKHGANRCFVYQTTVLITGLFLLISGPGIEALSTNWVIFAKTILLFILMRMLSYVHFNLQPKIETLLSNVGPDTKVPDDLVAQLKRFRIRRKGMAGMCLFLVITIIILGLQVYGSFNPALNVLLISLAALFAIRASKTLIRFGWI